jgi:hypothetical protein
MPDFEILFHIPTREVSYGLLCLFLVPVQGNNGQVMLDLPDLTTIVQDPHAHCTNCENHYINVPNAGHCAHFAARSEI